MKIEYHKVSAKGIKKITRKEYGPMSEWLYTECESPLGYPNAKARIKLDTGVLVRFLQQNHVTLRLRRATTWWHVVGFEIEKEEE